jgi:hypothetical protein
MPGVKKTTYASRLKKAKSGLAEAQRKKKAVATRLMNLKAKPIKKKKKAEPWGKGLGGKANENAYVTLDRVGVDPGRRKKNKPYRYKKGDPVVLVGKKQMEMYDQFNNRKRSNKKKGSS